MEINGPMTGASVGSAVGSAVGTAVGLVIQSVLGSWDVSLESGRPDEDRRGTRGLPLSLPLPMPMSPTSRIRKTTTTEASIREETQTCWSPLDVSDEVIISAVRGGDTSQFEELVRRYSPRIFATVRRHSRREDDVNDVVQDIFIRAFQRLASFRGDAPFEHWLMRLAVHACYDKLRTYQRNREDSFSDLAPEETDWLERFNANPSGASDSADAAKSLVTKVLNQLSAPHRLILTLLELEERSVKEIAQLTGWSIPLVKVRAFRARAEMKKVLHKLDIQRYL